MAWKLPDYIGHPGYQYSPDGVPSMLFEHTLDDTLQIATLEPLKPVMEKNINLYKGENAWGDFVTYLGANQIEPSALANSEKGLRVVLSQVQPLTESYTNEFGPSELASTVQNISSGGMQELAFMSGYEGKKSLEELKEKGGLTGAMASGYDKATDLISGAVTKLTNADLGEAANEVLKNPTAKIDIPNMWKGSSFTSSYQITIRLYCFSPKDDDHFTRQILAPLGALMMFVAPKSESGKFYTWPFMVKFKIKGQAYIPLGYVQSLDVVKGGDVSDISWIKRPGTVDVRMTINTVFGVRTNSKGGEAGHRPTILQELKLMYEMEDLNLDSVPQSVSINPAQTQNQPWSTTNGRTEETPEAAEDAIDTLFEGT